MKNRILSVMVLAVIATLAFTATSLENDEGLPPKEVDFWCDPGIGYHVLDIDANDRIVVSNVDNTSKTVTLGAMGYKHAVEVTDASLSGSMHIPSTVTNNGMEYVVVMVHEYAVQGKPITDLVLPDTVQYLQRYAFADCGSLTSVTLSKSLTESGFSAFSGCGKLSSVTLNDDLKSISPYMFNNCTSLGRIALPSGLENIGSYAFSGCPITEMTIPDNVRSLGCGVFSGCGKLTDVQMSKSVTTLPMRLFEDCKSLTHVDLNEGLQKIDGFAFISSGIKTIIIPSTVNSIGCNSFAHCTSLQKVGIPESLRTIGYKPFYNTNENIQFDIPANLQDKLTKEDLLNGNITIKQED